MRKHLVILLWLILMFQPSQAKEIKMCLSLDPPPNSAAGIPKLFWPAGASIKVKFLGTATELQKNKVKLYSSQWSQYANVKFIFVDAGFADIRISFNSVDGSSWSKIGTSSQQVPENLPTMNFGWFNTSTSEDDFSATILHEFGHALGLIHEHQSPTGKIKWNKTVAYEYYLRTQGWPKNVVDLNVFQKYDISFANSTVYDPTSIMHYPIDPVLTTNNYSVGWNTKLSEMDIHFIERYYPVHSQSSTKTPSGGFVHRLPSRTGVQFVKSFAFPLDTLIANASNACFYYDAVPTDPIYMIDPPDQSFHTYMKQISQTVGLSYDDFIIKCGNVPNACATYNEEEQKRYVIVSQQFFESLADNTRTSREWLALSIIAHELAHHWNHDTFKSAADRHNNELNADRFSGTIMGKLGVDLATAQMAINTISVEQGSLNTYPPRSARLEAIAVGWRAGANKAIAISSRERRRDATVKYSVRRGWGKLIADISLKVDNTEKENIIGVVYELPENNGFEDIFMSSYDKNTNFSITLGLHRSIDIKAKIIYGEGDPQTKTVEKKIVIN